ncbi:MAG: hypothetical protein MK052_04445 [Alphaproteobacteria bacterium]|nr:hypothetical protein [Alphaproteobacteria bacterium]
MTGKSINTKQNQDLSKFSVSKRECDAFDQDAFNPVKGETALWTAVITQALMDAGSESRKPEAQHEKAKAIRWLLGNSEDFITVCQNAGRDPQVIRHKAMAAIERGCVWRQGMAEKRAASKALPSKLERKYYIPTTPKNQPSRPHTNFTPLPLLSKSDYSQILIHPKATQSASRCL